MDEHAKKESSRGGKDSKNDTHEQAAPVVEHRRL
jgi:hypothetical protein